MKKLVCLVLAVMLALSAVSAFAAEYTNKDTVQKVQQALNDAGYNCGTPDGVAGKNTKNAITSYQTDKGLTATGVIDDELLNALGLAEAETAEETHVEAETAGVEETIEADEGYTFQGISWGSSPEEVEAILVENELIEEGNLRVHESNTFYYPDATDRDVLFGALTGNTGTIDSAGEVGGYSEISDILKEIGGYKPLRVKLSFLYSVENGQIKSDLHLTMVVVEYDYDETIFNGLTEKLNAKYGSCDSWNPYYDTYANAWYGTENTIIVLYDYYGYDYLVYAKSDGFITADNIKTINEANKTPLEDAGL